MNKLSDYRIKETPDGFVIEKVLQFTRTRLFRKEVISEYWIPLNFKGTAIVISGSIVYTENQVFLPQKSVVAHYKTLEEAQEKIIEWCEYPKYHYIASLKGEHKVSDIEFSGQDARFFTGWRNIVDVVEAAKNQVKEVHQNHKTVDITIDSFGIANRLSEYDKKIVSQNKEIIEMGQTINELRFQNAKLNGIIEGLKSKK